MATLTAAYATQKDPWRLAGIVGATALVLWVAHVYAHALRRAITHGRPSVDHLGEIAREEAGIALAAVPPMLALLLGAVGLVRESRSAWLALITGLVVLAAEGIRYARLERLGPTRTLMATGLNLCLGLLVVALKVLVAH